MRRHHQQRSLRDTYRRERVRQPHSGQPYRPGPRARGPAKRARARRQFDDKYAKEKEREQQLQPRLYQILSWLFDLVSFEQRSLNSSSAVVTITAVAGVLDRAHARLVVVVGFDPASSSSTTISGIAGTVEAVTVEEEATGVFDRAREVALAGIACDLMVDLEIEASW